MESQIIYYTVEDFLKDGEFIRYVFDTTDKTASRWEELFNLHPDLKEKAAEATAVLLASGDVLTDLTPPEAIELKERIFKTLQL